MLCNRISSVSNEKRNMDKQLIYEARKAIERKHKIPILTLAFNVINGYHAYDGHDRFFMCNPCYCQGQAMILMRGNIS